MDTPEFSTNDQPHPGMGFVGERRIRVWPFQRKHPAFGTVESCRIDITLDGTFETQCTQGRLFAVGTRGLLQKQVGEILRDPGRRRVVDEAHAAAGPRTEEISCAPLGVPNRTVLAGGVGREVAGRAPG